MTNNNDVTIENLMTLTRFTRIIRPDENNQFNTDTTGTRKGQNLSIGLGYHASGTMSMVTSLFCSCASPTAGCAQFSRDPSPSLWY